MKVEVVLSEADIAEDFVEAVEARDLPEKFFFWFPRSAAEWSALIGDPELYGGLSETWKELRAEAPALARPLRGRRLVARPPLDECAERRGGRMSLLSRGCQPVHAGNGVRRRGRRRLRSRGNQGRYFEPRASDLRGRCRRAAALVHHFGQHHGIV